MGNSQYRLIPVKNGKVQCLENKEEPVDHCRFCIHAREFFINGKFVTSPSLAYCTKCRATEEIDVKKAESVACADRQGEGFHSIANIIG